MAVFAADGRFGSGKTAFCVWFARELANRRGGCPIWANFDLAGAKPIYTFEDLYKCDDGVIVLDELQGTIHARQSSKNLDFLKWFDQCRKQNSDVICITQSLPKIDVIVREMIDIAFSCEAGDGDFSRISAIDMHTGRSRDPFRFDRSVSYNLYNTRERAWALVPADQLDAKPETKRGARAARTPRAAFVPPHLVEVR